MILKVFHQMSRTVVQPRCLDLMARRLSSSLSKSDVSAPRLSFSRICLHSDICTYGAYRENHTRVVRFGGISCNYFPLRVSALTFSSDGTQIDQKSAKSKEAGGLTKKDDVDTQVTEDEGKLSIFKRFKKMYRDYWYVLLPVHVITSLGWFGGFYYLAKSGVDIMAVLETLGISEHIPNTLKDSSAGYLAVSYALYKIATPLRYTVTIGGTTIAIKYLKGYGYIKPIPPKEKLKEIYQEKKETFMEKRQHLTSGIKQKREQFKERRNNLIRERREQADK